MYKVVEMSLLCRHIDYSCLSEHSDSLDFFMGRTMFVVWVPMCQSNSISGRVRSVADTLSEVFGDDLVHIRDVVAELNQYAPYLFSGFESETSPAFKNSYTTYYWLRDIVRYAEPRRLSCHRCGKHYKDWDYKGQMRHFKDRDNFCSYGCWSRFWGDILKQEKLKLRRLKWLRTAEQKLAETRKMLRDMKTHPA